MHIRTVQHPLGRLDIIRLQNRTAQLDSAPVPSLLYSLQGHSSYTMIACQRPIALQGTDYKSSSALTNINTVKASMKHPAPRQARVTRPSKIQLPPLHDLSDWSFSPEHTSGPSFEDTTFDNSTLWARHRYLCFGDAKRSQLIFSSQIFDGEVACHTSLIRLRRECKDAELWIQVERQCHYTGAWTVLN